MNRNKYSDIIYICWKKHIQLSSLLNCKYKGKKQKNKEY